MRLVRRGVAAFVLSLLGQHVAAWSIDQGNGQAVIRHDDQGYSIVLRCTSATRNIVEFAMSGPGFAGRADLRGVLLWIDYPDGRKGRQPIDVTLTGQQAVGNWYVSEIVMEEFRNGVAMEVALNGAEIVLRTDMNGSGAARLAILEQCGF